MTDNNGNSKKGSWFVFTKDEIREFGDTNDGVIAAAGFAAEHDGRMARVPRGSNVLAYAPERPAPSGM